MEVGGRDREQSSKSKTSDISHKNFSRLMVKDEEPEQTTNHGKNH